VRQLGQRVPNCRNEIQRRRPISRAATLQFIPRNIALPSAVASWTLIFPPDQRPFSLPSRFDYLKRGHHGSSRREVAQTNGFWVVVSLVAAVLNGARRSVMCGSGAE
jgi:hypothetical protein